MTIRLRPLRDAELTSAEAAPPRDGLGALATERGNLPLEEVQVRARITGLVTQTSLTQVFSNGHDVPLEATYIFPLPDRAAVTAIRMESASGVVEGRLRERQQAREEYDRALAAGHRAAIAEEDRPDVFTLRVGNIPPGERVTVRLTLAGAVPYEDGAATWRFPLVVAPRYVPGTPIDGSTGDGVAPDTDAVPDASRITPPILLPGFPNPVRLSVSVDLDPAGLPLREVRSSLHDVVTATETDGVTRIQLTRPCRLDRDFVLRWDLAGSADAVTRSLVLAPDHAKDQSLEGTFQLSLLPPQPAGDAPPQDVVLVLDRSGSMAGWKIVAARRAAARIVDSLTTADRFAVLGFDNVVQRPDDLGGGLSCANDRNRFRAVEFLAGLSARGGTEMLRPLHDALTLLEDTPTDRERTLVLITDGQVGNEDQILRELTPGLSSVRVHTVGIDQAVNAGFLARLAAAGGGRCELVESEDRLDEAMDQVRRRIATPVVIGLSLNAEGGGIDQVSPSRLPDLVLGTPVRIAGRYRGALHAITVTGQRPDGKLWQVTVPASTTDNPVLAPVWARARLRDLEDRYTATPAPRDRESLEQTIVATSLRFGVLCRFTAFVAVDERAVAAGTQPHRVVQPVELPSGWQPLAVTRPAHIAGPGAPLPPMPTAMVAPPGAVPLSPAPTLGARGARAGEGPSDPPDLGQVMAAELRRLEGLAHAGALRRWNALADLASRLRALAGQWPGPQREALFRLLESLAVCDNPVLSDPDLLERLWRQTLTQLRRHAVAATPSRTAPSRTGFWKRR